MVRRSERRASFRESYDGWGLPGAGTAAGSGPASSCCIRVAAEYLTAAIRQGPADIECRVLVYSCYSAAGGDEAFGRRAALELRKLGYKKCQLWGYTEAVAQAYYGGEKGAGGVSSDIKKRIFPPDINDEHPHRYSKKGHRGIWKRGSEALERLDMLP